MIQSIISLISKKRKLEGEVVRETRGREIREQKGEVGKGIESLMVVTILRPEWETSKGIAQLQQPKR